jgi:hypothetical protein
VAPFGVAAVIGTFSLSLAVLAAAVYARDPGIREL